MITDQLDKCPFCQGKMEYKKWASAKIMDCPKEQSHINKIMWAYLEDPKNPDRITVLNIRVDKYQLHFNFRNSATSLLDKDHKTIVFFNYILDFTLDEETINRKIKTILTFM
jgi:hypothetical protein